MANKSKISVDLENTKKDIKITRQNAICFTPSPKKLKRFISCPPPPKPKRIRTEKYVRYNSAKCLNFDDRYDENSLSLSTLELSRSDSETTVVDDYDYLDN